MKIKQPPKTLPAEEISLIAFKQHVTNFVSSNYYDKKFYDARYDRKAYSFTVSDDLAKEILNPSVKREFKKSIYSSIFNFQNSFKGTIEITGRLNSFQTQLYGNTMEYYNGIIVSIQY